MSMMIVNGEPVEIPAQERAQIEAEWLANTTPTRADVDIERDRRLALPLTHSVRGQEYQFHVDEKSLRRVTAAAADAKFAILKASLEDPPVDLLGNYRWQWPDLDFAWITVGGAPVLLDAHEVAALGDTFMNWEPALIYAASAIKALDPIPADYADDARWP
ncbi:hypothetical protein [uncultured Roseobacter sp.]|uniref:DUF4376 domain-containing protein n=1 Tax=uncultured Roseobacter sp. TaxID=114847 RepID=UPI00261D22E5|nr:hypothetical protein [uncultured Roseobacter sp.]